MKMTPIEGHMYDSFLLELQLEYKEATSRHGGFHSLHEAYAVILEELDEFWLEVKKRANQRDRAACRKELVQIAAMCMRAYIELLSAGPDK